MQQCRQLNPLLRICLQHDNHTLLIGTFQLQSEYLTTYSLNSTIYHKIKIKQCI